MTHYIRKTIRVSVDVETTPVYQLEFRMSFRLGPILIGFWTLIRELTEPPRPDMSLAEVGQYLLQQELESDTRRLNRERRRAIIQEEREHKKLLDQMPILPPPFFNTNFF